LDGGQDKTVVAKRRLEAGSLDQRSGLFGDARRAGVAAEPAILRLNSADPRR
jgi:hypothetical protein